MAANWDNHQVKTHTPSIVLRPWLLLICILPSNSLIQCEITVAELIFLEIQCCMSVIHRDWGPSLFESNDAYPGCCMDSVAFDKFQDDFI